MRSIYCGQVTSSHVEQTVTLCGWVHRRRDLGGLIFIDMRDREGIVQVFFDPDKPEAFALASELRNEFCISVTGVVRARPLFWRVSSLAMVSCASASVSGICPRSLNNDPSCGSQR